MKLIAANDGISSLNVRARIRIVLPNDIPSHNEARIVPIKIAVPGSESMLRSTIAASGTLDATGGTRITALCSIGIACLSEANVRYLLIAGYPAMKIKTDASRNGDHPFKIFAVECCG